MQINTHVLYILFLASGFVGIVLNATIAGANDIRVEITNYSLEVAIAAEDDVSSEAGGTSDANSSERDVLVAGTNFNATGEIPCARQKGQPMRSCRFGVIRRGNGSATVRIFWPDNGERNLDFENGKVSSSDTESGEGVEREGDLNKVFIGTEERFEIPDAVIYGG